MKKINLRDLFIGIIVGGLVFSGITVFAITLAADQITYTPNNTKFSVTNAKDALDEIYKISEYEIPKDTYFYDANTSGDDIVRYKKVDGKYYLCNENGTIIDNTSKNVTNLSIIEYTSVLKSSILAGKAGYASNNIVLGQNKGTAR